METYNRCKQGIKENNSRKMSALVTWYTQKVKAYQVQSVTDISCIAKNEDKNTSDSHGYSASVCKHEASP